MIQLGRLSLHFIVMAIIILFRPHADVLAQQSVPVTTQELTERSRIIVIGTVINKSSAWDNWGRELYTYITLRVDNTIKSNKPGSDITIRQLGGKVGDIESRVQGLPDFEKGERVLVFLGPYTGTPYYGLIDWVAGKYTIKKDKKFIETLYGTGPAHGQSIEQFTSELRGYL